VSTDLWLASSSYMCIDFVYVYMAQITVDTLNKTKLGIVTELIHTNAKLWVFINQSGSKASNCSNSNAHTKYLCKLDSYGYEIHQRPAYQYEKSAR
jgi:hypothetical protein